MRQRAPGVGEPMYFGNGSAPQSIDYEEYAARAKAARKGEEEFSERRTWSLIGLGLCLVVMGGVFAGGAHYAGLRWKASSRYGESVRDWDAQHKSEWEGTKWYLVHDGQAPIALDVVSHETRPVSAFAPEPLVVSEFRTHGLLDRFFPYTPQPDALHTKHKMLHSKYWRPVIEEFDKGLPLSLMAVDKHGDESVIDLGTVVFHRERTIKAGGESRCRKEQRGVWEEDNTCTVAEYLFSLCYKVSRDSVGRFDLDKSRGGPGCFPDQRKDAGSWGRLSPQTNGLHNKIYLPKSAMNATILRIRHAMDPALLEAQFLKENTPHVSRQTTEKAFGYAMLFLGIVVLVPAFSFGGPQLKLRWQKITRRRKDSTYDK